MAAQDGRSLVLKVGDGASPETFTTVAGCRTNSITMNEETVDITNKSSSDKFRELARFGVKTVSFSGAGIFTDHASHETVRANYFGTLIKNWQVVVPDFGTFEGAFVISSLTFNGPDNQPVDFDVALESAGTVTFTAS